MVFKNGITFSGSEMKDHHSYSNPHEVRMTHLDLDLEVLFDACALRGTATLSLAPHDAATLVLDTRDLIIHTVEISADGSAFEGTGFALGATDKILGTPLQIAVVPGATHVRVNYQTNPAAGGLQWLDPPQTAGGQHPYLYSQSEPILARTWIPLQDSPAVRITYTARIRTPEALVAVMGAESEPATHRGEYRFRMPQAIPAYLIALAVGDLEFRATGPPRSSRIWRRWSPPWRIYTVRIAGDALTFWSARPVFRSVEWKTRD
jgi:leukotriene-A4 hydrolase